VTPPASRVDAALRWREEPRPGDPDSVARIVRATDFFNDEEVAIARELAEERLARGPASGYEFLFAERGERAVGYACYGRIGGTRESWDLYWIAVEPTEQGRGLGRELLAQTEARVHAAGGRRLYVETSGRPSYATTRDFYARLGYALEATLGDFYAPGDAKCIYVKLV
jgi:GNAT superfamily N-acetyltransferase